MVETHLKHNYIDWLPVKNGEAVLCVSEKLENLEGMWDYLIISEAFAKASAIFSGEDAQIRLLETLKTHLKPQGHVILAVDNRYGLKYFAGCKEYLSGRYFEGLEGYRTCEGIATFSKKAVLGMAAEAGFSHVGTYYPYPDYRYMKALYTEEWLPAPGELSNPSLAMEEERIQLFNESAVFDGLIKEGRFTEFSNSYLFDLTLEGQEREEELLFLKYSVEREERYRIRTEILRKKDGSKVVRKIPYGEKAVEHVRSLKYWESRLREQYERAGVAVNQCTLTQNGAEFEFLKGETLEEVLDGHLAKNDLSAFMEELRSYVKKLEEILRPEPFVADEAFRRVFGDIPFDTPQSAAPLNNIDLIFSNIILTDGKWNVIDYEWTFDFAIPMKFIIHRAIVLYCGRKKQKSLQCMEICQQLGITQGEQQRFLEMEHRLQNYLLGDTKTLEALQLEYAGKCIDLKEILHRAHQPQMKVYPDFGQGFSEENAYLIEAEEDFYGRRRFTLSVPQNAVAIRLDPCEEPCQVTFNRILGECAGSYELMVSHNGKSYDKSVLYTTNDPQLIFSGIVPGTGQIHVDLTVEYLKEETGYLWMKLLEKAEKLDRIEQSKPYRIMKKIKNRLKKG